MMKKLILTLIFSALSLTADVLYTGTIGTIPITAALTVYSDKIASGFYFYDKVHIPIPLEGKLSGSEMHLREWGNGRGKAVTGSFSLLYGTNPDTPPEKLIGQWKNPTTGKTLPAVLHRKLLLNYSDETSFTNEEFPASSASEDHWFVLLLSKKEGETARITGLKVFSRASGKLVQQIDDKTPLTWVGEEDEEFSGFDFELRTGYSLDTGDYNFDGRTDIALFEASSAGPNVVYRYLLRSRTGDGYTETFSLGSEDIDFDAERKEIHVTSSCCGHRLGSNSTYRFVKNRLTLVDQQCWEHTDDGEVSDVSCSE